MLVYHCAFDVYHTIFRVSLLLEAHPDSKMPVDSVRILDLLFMFPYLIANVEYPKGAGKRGGPSQLAIEI